MWFAVAEEARRTSSTAVPLHDTINLLLLAF